MSLIGQDVTVLGAGIAGLAVARALAMRGASVTLLEQAEAVREVGAGLQISPNGAAVLRALGLGDELERIGLRASAVELRDGLDGDLVTRLDVARLRPGLGWHFVHRADLIEVLLQGARQVGVELRLLQRITDVDLNGHLPKWTNAQGQTQVAPLLIGADGLHSRLREALNGRVAPFFTLQVAWRAVVPETPGQPAVAEVHMGPGRHLVSYPLRGGAWRNIVAVEERNRWVEESWSLRDDDMELKLAFEGFGPRVTDWLDKVQDAWLWGLFRHPVARIWGKATEQGGAVLLGDAAHPTLPFLAQGANMALEDAWVLAECLSNHDSLAAAFSAYQHQRQARCTMIVDAATKNARNYHLSGPAKVVGHAVLRLGGRIAPNAALSRYDWIYQKDVTRP